MVKNIKGGKGSKSFARKSMLPIVKTSVRVPENPLELIAIVSKFYGNMCDVKTADDKSYKCILRKKFRGRFMHSSMIATGNIIMIGLRDYEAPNYKTCDLLEVYDANDVRILSNMPSINIQPLIAIQNAGYTTGKSGGEFNVFFSNDAEMPDLEDVSGSAASAGVSTRGASTTTSASVSIRSIDEVEIDEEINPDDI